ncbi:MAG TPA: 23S rRNA (uracil(1939)-C(5))-methyltransferase RlmD [Cyanobacteria bacterium UBA10660]|nr:MAG TPA: 23S rRNA (uracil(1939)-C(5))-methyltransferase RlmD [Candidatus Gastranaerophilales bacterium HUM_1]HAS93972.1 23S rRNA (uracil(1939)-C(5))-methyltransferase RlmD [Cyanobacteria bacterium UBA10660]
MKINDEYTVKIEKITNLGFGLAKIDGFVVFVKDACPEDTAKIKITKVNKNFANGEIIELIEPSKHRVTPFCPMQKVCGACQLQFIDYDYQLELKQQIVQDAMKTIGNLDIEIPRPIPSPEIKNYRHKIQYPVTETKNSKRILAGYYKPGTHEIVNIKYCPIQPEICDRIIEFIREKAFDYGISGFNEKKHSGDLRHIVIRSSLATGKNLVILVVNATKTFDRLNDFAKCIFEEFYEVAGVCVNFNSKKTNVILGNKTECLAGKDFVKERILDKTFRIGPNTFFQVNPKSAENIFRYVKEYIQNNFENPIILDAYAGITSFGICISDICKKVVSVEENKEATELARETAKVNNIENVEIHNQDAAKFFEKEKRKFDAIILDPPRKGCTKESLDEACRLSKGKILYVSCNPATLARDLKYLKEEKGATIESIQPFDMFCHTYHIENVAIINV